MPNAGTPLVTLFRRMDVYVCTDDIDSSQSTMQMFTGRVYMGTDMDKHDKNTKFISDYCLYIEHIDRMFWGHIKLLRRGGDVVSHRR